MLTLSVDVDSILVYQTVAVLTPFNVVLCHDTTPLARADLVSTTYTHAKLERCGSELESFA